MYCTYTDIQGRYTLNCSPVYLIAGATFLFYFFVCGKRGAQDNSGMYICRAYVMEWE